MQAYLLPLNEGLKLLGHGHFRWAQKAPCVSMDYRFIQRCPELRQLMHGSAEYQIKIPRNGAM